MAARHGSAAARAPLSDLRSGRPFAKLIIAVAAK